MSAFLRIRNSVRLPRSLPATLQYRFLSGGYNSQDNAEPHSVVKLYEQACERSIMLERQWIQRRKDAQEASANSPTTFPSHYRNAKDALGQFDMNFGTEAQKEAEKFSKYAWIPCNYTAKFVLMAPHLYFSLDEIKAYSGVYLVSVAQKHADKIKKPKRAPAAKKRSTRTKKVKENPAATKEEPADEKVKESAAEKKAGKSAEEKEESANKKKGATEKKKSSITFPYHERKVLFRADTLQEAMRLADALVEKMIKSKPLLASMERYAPWRNESSTAAQINFLLRLGANSREQDTMKVALTMNKGEVCSIIADAVMKFEKTPKPEETEDEGDQSVVQEVLFSSDLHSNFMLSGGLWDLES